MAQGECPLCGWRFDAGDPAAPDGLAAHVVNVHGLEKVGRDLPYPFYRCWCGAGCFHAPAVGRWLRRPARPTLGRHWLTEECDSIPGPFMRLALEDKG